MAFDPRELRDPHGKWTKSGGIASAHAAAAAKIAALPRGKKMGLHGATIDNIPSKGLRVRVKGETRHYGADHNAAAQAVVEGSHREAHPGAEGALRQVAGGRGKVPASPKVPAGVPSEAELRDKSPAQLAEMANITRGQGDYPGRELTLQRIRSEQVRRQKPGVAVKQPDVQTVARARVISGQLAHPGYVPTDSEHQALKDALEAAGRLGGPDTANYRIIKTALVKSRTRRGKAAPYIKAPEDQANHLSNVAFNQGDGSQSALNSHRDAAAAHRKAASLTSSASQSEHHSKMAALHSKVAAGKMYSRDAEKQASGPEPPSGRGALDRVRRLSDAEVARRERILTGGRPASVQQPKTMAQIQQEIHNKDIELREMSAEGGAPYYSPKELIDTRRDDVTRQLAQGHERITVKVPSGSEVQFTATTARHLLGQNVRPSPGGPARQFRQTAGAPNPLQRRFTSR